MGCLLLHPPTGVVLVSDGSAGLLGTGYDWCKYEGVQAGRKKSVLEWLVGLFWHISLRFDNSCIY